MSAEVAVRSRTRIVRQDPYWFAASSDKVTRGEVRRLMEASLERLVSRQPLGRGELVLACLMALASTWSRATPPTMDDDLDNASLSMRLGAFREKLTSEWKQGAE